VGPHFEVYDGHQRLSALLVIHGAGYELDARQASRELSDTERRELVVSLHAGAVGSWDWDRVSSWDASELQGWGMDKDLLSGWGQDYSNLKELLRSEEAPPNDAEPEEDKAEELQEKWQTEPGQIWQIGNHRLLIGDCTLLENTRRLMEGKRAAVCFTSPPYADQRDYEIGNFDYMALYNGFISNTEHCNDILVNLGMKHEGGKVVRYWEPWLEYCETIGLPLFGWYVWDQLSGFPGDHRGRLARSHEFVFHFRREAKQANKWVKTTGESILRGTHGKRFRQKDGSLKELGSPDTVGQEFKVPDSVIRIRREMARGIHTQAHPAVYPVELAEFGVKTWSNEGDIVYEPFSGSGSTIVACENTGRQARAIELEPGYSAVSLQRYYDAFGIEPILLERS
jgi:DNA modification methylase